MNKYSLNPIGTDGKPGFLRIGFIVNDENGHAQAAGYWITVELEEEDS